MREKAHKKLGANVTGLKLDFFQLPHLLLSSTSVFHLSFMLLPFLASSFFFPCILLVCDNCVSSMQINEIKVADIPDVDLSRLGVTKYGNFSVEVVDPVSDYLELLEVGKKDLHR